MNDTAYDSPIVMTSLIDQEEMQTNPQVLLIRKVNNLTPFFSIRGR
jgi:hypothetical protein